MRSTSRRPRGSKSASSTRSACSEKSAKFTPAPFQVAPKGYGLPGRTAARLRVSTDENHGCQRRKGDAQRMRAAMRRNLFAFYNALIADVAAAVVLRVRVERLGVAPGFGYADPVPVMNHRRRVERNHGRRCSAIASEPRKCEHAVDGVLKIDPLEPARLRIELVEGGRAAVQAVAVAD